MDALYTFIVFSMEDADAVTDACRKQGLPIPNIGVVDYEPDAKLYQGLPPMQKYWEEALKNMPPMVANYLIDMYEVEKLFLTPGATVLN